MPHRPQKKQMNKKPVFSSNLSLRFYKCQGWTKEILDQYAIKGAVIDRSPYEETPRDYWLIPPTGKLDLDRLYHDHVSEVYPYPGHYSPLEGLDYMRYIQG